MSDRPRVLVVVGYFDWFSGYQETVLVLALAKHADVEVMASDRVSPAFKDQHLATLGLTRRYEPGTQREHGVLITRYPSREIRSMVWSSQIRQTIRARSYNLIVQVMPGQGLSAAPTFTRNPAPRVALYGDNRGMWSRLTRVQRLAKGTAFTASKGLLYTAVNSRSRATYGYTPDTLRRLRVFRARRPSHLLPLASSPETFHPDQMARSRFRAELGLPEDQILVVAAGRMHPEKRVEWLLGAFASLASAHPQAHLLLLGATIAEYPETVQRVLNTAGLNGRIHIRPFTNAAGLNAAFNGADLGVWPRLPAITIQQAMGTGLSVLLPRNDLVGHLLKPSTGHYFELDELRAQECVRSGLARAIKETDFSGSGRRDRATTNQWLSASSAARQVLVWASDQ